MKSLIIPLIVLLALLWPLPASAWGPVGHEAIATEMSAWTPVDGAFRAGVVMVDVSLARFDTRPAEQGMFHDPTYLANLKTLANTSELKSFVRGYETHLTSDQVQNNYGGSADTYVDTILRPSPISGIILTDAEADLLIAGWQATYPDYSWQPTRDWIMVTPLAFAVYFTSPNPTEAERQTALALYPDYQAYLTLSAKNSLDKIVKRGDANRDGNINMGDVIYIERVIMGLSPKNAESDANSDWTVDMGDVVKVERIIMGME